MPVDTNIIIFRITDELIETDLIKELKSKGILVVGFGNKMIRMVTHLDFNDGHLETLKSILLSM